MRIQKPKYGEGKGKLYEELNSEEYGFGAGGGLLRGVGFGANLTCKNECSDLNRSRRKRDLRKIKNHLSAWTRWRIRILHGWRLKMTREREGKNGENENREGSNPRPDGWKKWCFATEDTLFTRPQLANLNTNIYNYLSGKCQKIILNFSLLTFKFFIVL